jgi:allantoinase
VSGDFAIRSQRLVTPEGERSGIVEIRDGLITAIRDSTQLDSVIDVPDDCAVLPGLVDSHVHVNEPGRTEWEGFATATAAAAAGGITTIADMPLNSIPPTVDVPALAAKRAAAQGQCAVDVAFWGGAIPGNTEVLPDLYDAGVVGFKCFLLPAGVDEFPPLDSASVRDAMRMIAGCGGTLIAHCEDAHVISRAPKPRSRRFADYLASRPDAAETVAVENLLAATGETGCRTHIVHLSSAQTLPLVAAAKHAGLPVTAETCPHYLSLVAEQVPDGATQFKSCPPIRSYANREQLWRGMAAGIIDCVVSDHSPCPPAMKHLESGDFGVAWGGIASVQLSLPVVWTQAVARGFMLTDIATWMARKPAELIGLTDRGAIRVGSRADLAMFAPDESFRVDPAMLQYRHPISPYAGATLRGVVRQTWLRGQIVGSDRLGELVCPGQSRQPRNDSVKFGE